MSPEIATKPGGEEAINDGVGGGVEGRQTLHEGSQGLALGGAVEHLQEVVHDVRRPAHYEHCAHQSDTTY